MLRNPGHPVVREALGALADGQDAQQQQAGEDSDDPEDDDRQGDNRTDCLRLP